MDYKIQEVDDLVVIFPPKQIYCEEAAIMREDVLAYLDRGNFKFLFDFSHVTYIDSSGIGALIALNKRVGAVGEVVVIRGLKGVVRELFELTALDQIFKLE